MDTLKKIEELMEDFYKENNNNRYNKYMHQTLKSTILTIVKEEVENGNIKKESR